MKKVYLLINLFIIPLFFFSINEVKADTVYTISETDFNYLNDEFYLMRDLAIEYCKNNDTFKLYLIQYVNNRYQVMFLKESDYIHFKYSNSNIILNFNGGSSREIFKLNEKNELYNSASQSFLFDKLINNGKLNYSLYLDSNFKNTFYTDSTAFTIQYDNLNYSIQQNSTIPTLYQIYLDYNAEDEPDDKFIEDKEIMNSFYSIILIKISELSTIFANNYIFLSIIGIFILIFVLELIRRYFL